jgi:hypothetical protein
MRFLEDKLPSNRKFGLFFTLVFAVVAAYFFYSLNMALVCVFVTASSTILVITLVKSDSLMPLNKLWMRLGLLISMIVSPIVLGVIFFGLFTPIALFMRLIGRDKLRLKISKKSSHWISRSEQIKSETFKQQF